MLCSELFTASGSLQMRGAARPGSYQNQWKGMAISKPKPRRNRSNTIPNANKTIPAETPIIPVTLITRPIMIPLSAIADLLAPLFDHLVGASEQRRRHGEAKYPGGLGVDDQFELTRLHNRQFRRPGALENATCIDADLTISICQARTVAHQTDYFGKLTHRI